MDVNLKEWLETTLRRKITVQEIADTLDISRNTAGRRISEGFTTDEIIHITTTLGAPPALALVELGILTQDQFVEALPHNARPIHLLSDAQVAHELFHRLSRKETDQNEPTDT